MINPVDVSVQPKIRISSCSVCGNRLVLPLNTVIKSYGGLYAQVTARCSNGHEIPATPPLSELVWINTETGEEIKL